MRRRFTDGKYAHICGVLASEISLKNFAFVGGEKFSFISLFRAGFCLTLFVGKIKIVLSTSVHAVWTAQTKTKKQNYRCKTIALSNMGEFMLNQTHGAIKIFAGNASKDLAQQICQQLDLQLGKIEVGKFSDGETSVNIKETVRGCDVFVVQSTCSPVNDNLMELLVIIDALKRASAGRITAVIPYFGYARQDRKARARDPISAKLVADILQTAGANRVLTMDLHSSQLQGFFNVPVDNLMGMPLLAKYFKKQGIEDDNLIVVSPDVGSVARSRAMAAKFNAPLAIIDKRRPKANVMEVMNIIGDVKGKTCLMFDDMIDTAGTITQGAQALADNGAAKIIACCTHAVLSGPAIQRLQDSPLTKVVVLDTIPLPESKKLDKIEVVPTYALFAEAIERVYTDLPVSKLYE